MNLTHQIAAIQSREDFVCFVQALQQDLTAHPDQWENETLPRYLAALAAWTQDMDGYYLNRGEPVPQSPDWKTLAEILLASKHYE